MYNAGKYLSIVLGHASFIRFKPYKIGDKNFSTIFFDLTQIFQLTTVPCELVSLIEIVREIAAKTCMNTKDVMVIHHKTKNTSKVCSELLRCTSSLLLYYFVNVAMIKSGNSRQHKKVCYLYYVYWTFKNV